MAFSFNEQIDAIHILSNLKSLYHFSAFLLTSYSGGEKKKKQKKNIFLLSQVALTPTCFCAILP